MPSKRLLVAALLLAGFALVACEDTFLHSDDGCAVETHCSVCLLRIATAGILPQAFALPDASRVVERLASESVTAPEPPDPRSPASRGPPTA
jgi:hypothetical protein